MSLHDPIPLRSRKTVKTWGKAERDAAYASALAEVEAAKEALYLKRYGRPAYVAPAPARSTAFDDRDPPASAEERDPYFTGRF